MNPKKTKILLLSVNSSSFFYDQLVIPFGLISLGSYIDNGDYEMKGIEMNAYPEKIHRRYLRVDENLLQEIIKFSPDIVAMSTYASNIYNVLFWAKVIKINLPNSFIIIGGNHASYIGKECLKKCSGVDIVVRFEGEIPFKMICEKIKDEDNDFSKIPSITYRINGEIKENPRVEFLKDINKLPLLNRDYFKNKTKTKEEIFHADIISARGCPFNCTFCNCNHYWSKVYRVRLIDAVIKELKDLQKKYPNLKSVRFRDESLTINKHRCKILCDAIKENEIKLEFQAHSRLDGLNEEVIQLLTKAGFKLLFIGMESGSKKVLKRLKKGIDISSAKKIITLLRRYGIGFRISFMSETPEETLKDVIKTIKLIKSLKLRKNEYYIGSGVAIYPGTQECDNFLILHPDYEWISNNYNNFKGKYYADRDLFGNILTPTYLEHDRIRRMFIRIYIKISTNPVGLLRYLTEIFNFIIKTIRLIIRKIFN